MMVLHLDCIYYVCIDYVAEIWEDLLGMSEEKRKSVAEKYSAKVPQPLNSQFPDRAKKSEAVGRYEERKEKEVTKLYPPGKAPALCQILTFSPISLGVIQKWVFFAVIVNT